MGNYVTFILLSLMSYNVFATSFVPVPIKKQIFESTGVVQGEVISSEPVEDENGKILTKIFIRADKWVGVKPSENTLTVYSPGGQIGDRRMEVHGSAKFEFGEQVVLFLKEYQGKYWVQNLALGKYVVKNFGNKKIMINTIFPYHPKVGQMPIANFFKLVERVKSVSVTERFKDKYELNQEKDNLRRQTINRSIASVNGKRGWNQKAEEEKISTFWLLVILGAIGALFTIYRRYSS